MTKIEFSKLKQVISMTQHFYALLATTNQMYCVFTFYNVYVYAIYEEFVKS